MKRFGRKKEFTTTRIIAVGFFVAIVIGTFLLMLPLSSKTGKATGIVDALFTSTTSVCVTGLVTVPTYAHWSLFGQVVIALLAQVGGLGVITFTTMFMLILRRRIGMKERLLIQDAYNLDTIQGLVVLVKKILKGTLVIETVGALLYMTVFIPDYGLAFEPLCRKSGCEYYNNGADYFRRTRFPGLVECIGCYETGKTKTPNRKGIFTLFIVKCKTCTFYDSFFDCGWCYFYINS